MLMALVLAAAACQEQLTAPADCPTACPGGKATIVDTVLLPVFGLDSTYSGYVPALNGGSALVTTGLAPVIDARAVFRFSGIPDSFSLANIRRGYTIDSVRVAFSVLERDTAATNLSLRLYRLPANTDTSVTFTAAVAAETAIPAVVIPLLDTLRGGVASVVLTGAALTRVAIPSADSGNIAFAVALGSSVGTGVRLQTSAAVGTQTAITRFISLLGLTGADTVNRKQVLTGEQSLGRYVIAPRPSAPPGALVVGGEPSSRAILRFVLPRVIKDSAALVRATLELVPVETVTGVPNLPTTLLIRSVLTDLGAKSPLESGFNQQPIRIGTSDTIRIEIGRIVNTWQGPTGRTQTIFLQTSPEGASWSRFAFGSTGGIAPPRLRITYIKSFPFEAP